MSRRNRRVGPGLLLALVLIIVSVGAAAAQDGATATDADPGQALLSGARRAAQSGEWSRALELSDEALYSGADKVQVLLLKARIYAGMHDLDRQRQALRAAVALDDSLCEPRLVLAMLEANRGLWQRAAELYRQAIAANPASYSAYLRLADLYDKNSQPQQALQVLQQAVENNPRDTRLLTALADMYRRRHLLQQAEAVYGQIVKVGDEAAQAGAYLRLGKIYAQVGQYADAFDCYEKAAKLEGSPGALHTDGYQQLFEAADNAVTTALEQAWRPYTAHVQGGPVAREEAYVAVQAAAQQINHIKQFAALAKVGPALQPLHRRRQLFYSVAYEAAFNAQLYLDTGVKQLRDAAGQCRVQAGREHKLLLAEAASAKTAGKD